MEDFTNVYDLMSGSVTKWTTPIKIGFFDTPISTVQTRVDFKIYSNYVVDASFRSHEVDYKFVINKWSKTQEDTKNPKSSFNQFAQLMVERYRDTSDKFGKIETKEEFTYKGTISKQTLVLSEENITNLLYYATVEVFICADQIINSHRRSLLDYCIFHKKRGLCDNYEHYIHLVACHCLVHSNYLVPGIKYHPVEFYSINREYIEALYQKSIYILSTDFILMI
jgi:hypothetical protein